MKSVMSHSFSQVPQANIPRSAFNRSHGYKTTFNAGFLIPVFVDEALPGDSMKLSMTTFARLTTPLVPVMDNMFLDSFFFAVPYRLVWNHWVNFNGEQANPGDSTDYTIPGVSEFTIQPMSLYNYFGWPSGINSNPTNSNLWARAYNLIWNTWFRDQNMQNSVTVDMGDGPDDPTNYVLLQRGKRHDYFTSCLPWPQKGPSVEIPLGTTAPIRGWNYSTGTFDQNMYVKTPITATSNLVQFPPSSVNVVGAPVMVQQSLVWPASTDTTGYDVADLTNATAATINALRQAFQLQKLYERDARGGTRYTEIIHAHFGVVSPDARLQRPEYLGGGSSQINFQPVTQTSATGIGGGSTPLANLAAIGVHSSHGHGFTKSFTEHCLLIGMVSVRADLNYQQGMNRMFNRQTRFDFYWPALSHIGEQAVLEQEIFMLGGGNPADTAPFGYQERYAEYRYKPSVITGLFASQTASGFDIWHLGQLFTGTPSLNATFIVENPPVSRIVALPDDPHFKFDAYFDYHCVRPMPVYSVPGLIDHF